MTGDSNSRGSVARPRRGGLYDSVDASPSASNGSVAAKTVHPKPANESNRSNLGHSTGLASAAAPSGGGGGLSGLRDPYDQPSRSQMLGSQSRLRQDKTSGALDEVAGRYMEASGCRQLVRKGLRRSIADAYAAYVGQVVHLPDDVYGLALGALDRSFNGRCRPAGHLDLQLATSPFATRRAKHAQIFNTAHKIMRDLNAYVYDVSYYCPGELDRLRGMRGPGGAAAAAGGAPPRAGQSAPRLHSGPPPLHEEAVGIAPRAAAGPRPRQAGQAGQRLDVVRSTPPPYTVNPITGAVRPLEPKPEHRSELHPQGRSDAARPQTAPPAGGDAAAGGAHAAREAAAQRSDGGGTGAAAEAPAGEAEGAAALAEAAGAADQEQRRRLRRLSSPGMFVKTPPHYRISKYYDHVSPTEDVLQYLQKRALLAAQRRQAAAAAESGAEGAGPGPHPGGDEEATLAVKQQVPSAAAALASRGGEGAWRVGGGRSPGRSSRPPAGREAAGRRDGNDAPVPIMAEPAAAAAQPRPASASPPPAATTTDRIAWIIETAYELGLAEALRLEGPPPYPRSHRLSPSPHRRQFYDAVYDSPERYGPYTEGGSGGGGGGDGGGGGGGGGRRWNADGGPGAPVPPGQLGPDARGVAREGHSVEDGGAPVHARGHGREPGYGRYGSPEWPRRGEHAHGGEGAGDTVRRLREAEARRYVRGAEPAPDAKLYGRSRRLKPW